MGEEMLAAPLNEEDTLQLCDETLEETVAETIEATQIFCEKLSVHEVHHVGIAGKRVACAERDSYIDTAAVPDENTDESDNEVVDCERDRLNNIAGVLQEPEEPWMRLPPHERALWERVRPRAVRREAAQAQGLRLPMASMSRLMRLHTGLHTRTSEALDIINHATVMVVQAVARATARRKALGQRIPFEDLRQICLSSRELRFLHPLNCSLDASAQVMRSDATITAQAAEIGRKNSENEALNASGPNVFGALLANAAKPQDETVNEVEITEVSPNCEARAGEKRSGPISVKKTSRKIPRRDTCKKGINEPEVKTAGTLASFFGRQMHPVIA